MVALNKTYRKPLTPDRSAKDSGLRFYSPEISRWLNRDPIGEKVEIATYVFVRNDVQNRVDLFGLWTRESVDGHIWQAQQDDMLSGLAAKVEYGGKGANWRCLWPVGNTADHGYPSRIKPCDRYDASNLALPAPGATRLKLATSAELYANHNHNYGGDLTLVSASSVAGRIRDTSGEGGTPIRHLTLTGHSGGGIIAGETIQGDPSSYSTFKLADLVGLDQAPSFPRAKQKKGPMRCWFTRNAMARFVGCNTSLLAEPFAGRVLRTGARSYGTTQTIAHQWGNIGWETTPGSGVWIWSTHIATAPVWNSFDGNWP